MIRLSQVSAAAPAMPPPHKTTFLGRIQSYSFSHITNTHQYSLASSLSLMSPSYAKGQATLHHIISYTITCHVLLRNFFSCDSSTCPLEIFHTGCMVPTLVLSSHVFHHCHRQVLLRHSWAIQSGAMLSPLMGREWEDVGGERPRGQETTQHTVVTKTCILRTCHWFFHYPKVRNIFTTFILIYSDYLISLL